jgi:helicase
MDERRRLEAAFKEKSIHTMVSTSTLAYGLNLPADVGVIVAAHRGPDMVDVADLKQEAGRIGRYGLSTEGKVFYLFPERYAESVFETLNKVPDIKSVLPKRLYFHITSLVTREGMQRKEVDAFLGKTLAAQQGTINVQEAFDILKEFEILREDSSGLLKPTPIARGSALMYVDPLDLYFWKRGFSGKPTEPEDIARAYVGIPSMEYQVHMPADLKDPLDMPFKQQQVVGSAVRDWLAGKPSDGYRAMIVPMIVRDFDRIASALKLAGVNKNYVESLSLMMKYGIREDLIDLVKVKGIGRKRAMALFQKGIKTPKEVTQNQQIAINILGRKLFEDVKKSVFSPGTFVLRF